MRFIGVTRHGSQIAATRLRSLERFDFDTVLPPYSCIVIQDAHYASAFNRQLRERVAAPSAAIGARKLTLERVETPVFLIDHDNVLDVNEVP